MSGWRLAATLLAVAVVSGCGSGLEQSAPPPATGAGAGAATAPAATMAQSRTPSRPTLAPPPPVPWQPFPAAADTALPRTVTAALALALQDEIGNRTDLGIACAIVNADRGTWTGVAGFERQGTKATAASVWETGSVAKTIVAAEVLRLVERGRIRLDADAGEILGPAAAATTNGARVADLLRMRSGIGVHQPAGSTFEYRNDDYILLGRIIEAVEGRPLGEVLTPDILAVPGAEGLRFPVGGTVDNAAGPFESDAVSLARWGNALFGRHLVTDPSLARMVDFGDGDYGMGVFDFSVDFGTLAVGHLGMEDAWSAALVALPERQLVIVVLMNAGDPLRTEGVAVRLASLLPG